MSFLRNPFFRFLLLGTVLYVSWYFLYELWLKPSTGFDDFVIAHIVAGSEWLLQFVGFTLYDRVEWNLAWNYLGIEGAQGVIVGAPCDGIVLFALFAIFIIAFPGPLKHKLWFIPAGLLSIHFINVLRVASLTVIDSINPEWLAFNHDYTFTVLVYAYVFWLWYVWVNRFSPLQLTKPPKNA